MCVLEILLQDRVRRMAFKGTVHSKIKCGVIERVLVTDSNEPSLASIRDLESSQKDDTRRHVIHIT